MSKKIFFSFLLIISINSYAQILGGGASFSSAVVFNQTWITGCPAAGTTLSNQPAFEPTTAMDACAPAPACALGTAGSDVWFVFYAQSTTATIVVNPSSSFDIAIQAFSGTACPGPPGLTNIGCVDIGGNNATETLILTGLTVSTAYYFRIFGATNSLANRTGTYTFCGSAGLGSAALPVEIISFKATSQANKVFLNWTTASESDNQYFDVERSNNGYQYESIGRIAGMGTTSQTTNYSFTDNVPFTAQNYYRLKQIDIDGRYKYSSILSIRMDSRLGKSLNITPNPVTEKINISVNSDITTSGVIKIMNSSGKIIYQNNEWFTKGVNVFTINSLDNLSKGVYILQVLIDNEMLSAKFISNK